ncbi:MAK10-like protein [Tanacetum coccineum]
MAGALPSDTVKNPTQNINSTSPALSARSYPTVDPQCSSHPSTIINAVKTCSKEVSHSQTSHLKTGIGIGTQQIGEPIPTLEDEFQDFHLSLPVLEGEVSANMKDPGLFTLPCRSGNSKPFDTLDDLGSYVEVHIGNLKVLNDFYVIDMNKDPETPLLVGRGFLATANAVIDCRKAKIAVGEGITRSVFGVKRVDSSEDEALIDHTEKGSHTNHDLEIARDAESNPFKDVLVFRRMVEFLGAIPINLKRNMRESEDLIQTPIN